MTTFLPILPRERTLSVRPIRSEKCQERTSVRVSLPLQALGILNRFQAHCSCIPAHRNMQLEAHRIEYSKNRREVRFLCIAPKRTMNACPRNSRFLRKVRNIVKVSGPANGLTNFGDIGLLESFIYEIGSRASRRRLWSSWARNRFFGHDPSNKIGRHFCRPTLLETM